jgi:LPS sulfotransferase NodH
MKEHTPNMPYFLRNQVTPYVILFIERDGSTYLTSLLTSHPDVEAIYERFAVLKQKGASAEEQLNWANEFFTAPLIGKTKARGFKTKLVDVLDLPGFSGLLREKDIKIIQMRRRNRVKAVVSRINARRLYEATGNWNLYNKSDKMPAMEVDLSMFDAYLKEREDADNELQAYVDDLQLPTLKIIYEDLLVNKDQVLNSVFDFLNIPRKQLQEKTLKNTSDDLRDVVLNFDLLKANYAGTPYEEMFDEVLV